MSAVRKTSRTAGGVKAHCLEGGSGPGLLLLHGLGASSYSWRRVVDALAETHSVCAPDLPGFGRSDKPFDFDYSLSGQGAWVRALMKELGWTKMAVAGNSMGGAIALRMALETPEMLESVTLLGCPVYPHNVPKILFNLNRPLIGRLLEPFVGPWLVGPLARTCFVDHSLITPELLEEYSAALREEGGRRAVVEFVRRAVPPDAAALTARYPRLSVPILAIRGEHDAVVDRESSEKFCRTAPNARFVALEACGHAPQEEKPEEVLAAMRAFISR